MPALPSESDWLQAPTEKAMKANFAAERAFLAGLLGQDGLPATARAALGVAWRANEECSAGFAVTAGQGGTIFTCSGSWTMTLPSAATAGNGFMFVVRNRGTGTITLALAGSDTIDGQATLSIPADHTALFYWRSAGTWGAFWLHQPVTANTSGSNGNGSWERRGNIQECWHVLAPATPDLTWTFPQAFVAAPAVTGLADHSGVRMMSITAISASAVSVRSANTSGVLTNFDALHVRAIGRWQ